MIFDYDAIMPDLCPPYRKALSEFQLRTKDSGAVFELGIGTGNIASAILKSKPSIIYSGVDIDQESLDIAKSKLNGYACSVGYGDISKVDIPSVDTIISSLCIHHLNHPEQEELLKRIYSTGKQFLHFELIAPEDEAEEKSNKEFLYGLVPDLMKKHNISQELVQKLSQMSAEKDKPMKFSEHLRVHKEIGINLDVVLKEYGFVFYQGISRR